MVKKILIYSAPIIISVLAFCLSYSATAEASDTLDQVENNEETAVNTDSQKDKFTVLLLGEDDAAGLTDVIMVVSYDTKNGQMSILQIPRDTYAEYTSAAYRKLNAASYVLDGGEGMKIFLADTLCIEIDHYVKLDLDTISQIVDLLGGIEIDVPCDMSYSDPEQGLTIHLKKGRQTLNGQTATHFLRYREGYVRGDLGRLDAQKFFLSAVMKKVAADKDITTLISLAARILPKTESDMSVPSCISFIKVFGGFDISRTYFITLPGGDIRGSSGAWYYVMNRAAAYKVIKEYFSPELTETEFDKDRKFTTAVRSGFNEIYKAETGYESKIYTADEMNGDMEIQKN